MSENENADNFGRDAVSLHFLNPEDEPRDCRCSCHIFATTNPDEAERWNHWKASHACECGGTGRLGIEGAEPDVEVCEFLMNDERALESRDELRREEPAFLIEAQRDIEEKG